MKSVVYSSFMLMEKTNFPLTTHRIRSIDILRALTMLLMIFVNDFWSLTDVPKWLLHTKAQEDGMGFSDVIFPMFLFIVGLSIPLAINIRIKKSESHPAIFSHILTRTLALLVMGFFMVNYGSINQEAMGFRKHIWQLLMAVAIFLIWMDYKRLANLRKEVTWGLKAVGVLILAYLAWVYKGGSAENLVWMKPHWWGILGLIGWAYLLNSLLYLFLGKRWAYLLIVFGVLLFMNVQESGFFEFLPTFQLVISASNHVLVMGGMLCTVLYLKLKTREKGISQFLALITFFGALFISYGFLIRPAFPISKILATPSWTAICMGISLLSYTLLYLLVDQLNFYKWANPIKPAGTSTLTCYLMPYMIYPIIVLVGFKWPEFLSTGMVGLMKSFLFSLAIILFVGVLGRWNVRLRI